MQCIPSDLLLRVGDYLSGCPLLQCRSISSGQLDGWSRQQLRILCHLPPPLRPPPQLPQLLPPDYLLWSTLATLTSLLPFLFLASYVSFRRWGRLLQPADRYRAAGTQTSTATNGVVESSSSEDEDESDDQLLIVTVL